MNKLNSNLVWADNIRFIATVFVIMIHVIFPVVQKFDSIDIGYWHIANIIESVCRSAVPLFVMLSGSLLLGKHETINLFFNKRIKKIGLPFLFWSLVYLCVAYTSEFILGVSNKNRILWILGGFKNGSAYHLWYLYMILGLYLIIPYLSKMVANMKTKDYYWFFGVWSVSLFLNYPVIKDYFPNFDLTFFTGYIGYLLLGFFLSKLESSYINMRFGIILLLLGWSSTALFTCIASTEEQKFIPIFYNYLSPNVALIAVGLFVIIRKINVRNVLYQKVTKVVSNYSYGMYLNHVIIITILYKLGIDWSTINPLIGVTITFFIVILLSILFVWLSERARMRKILG